MGKKETYILKYLFYEIYKHFSKDIIKKNLGSKSTKWDIEMLACKQMKTKAVAAN